MISAESPSYIATQLKRNLSPLRYPGGKRSFVPYLQSLIEANNLTECHYLEPYAGGGGAALELLRSGTVQSIHLNDKDPAIYWFWRAALTENARFIERILNTAVTIPEWLRQREILRTAKRGFDLGFAAFFMNRTCVSGIIKNCGGPIGGLQQNGTYKIDCRYYPKTLAEKILFLGRNKEKIKITNFDALTLLKRHHKLPSPTLTYLDPPYYHKAAKLYLNAYQHENHRQLRDFLLGNFDNEYWILSYDLCPEILQLYRHCGHRSVQTHHAAANKGRKLEFITISSKMGFPRE